MPEDKQADEPAADGAPVPQDLPGKDPQPAAASGAEPTLEEGQAPSGQGGQVILTGDAQAAARGGTHSEIAANTIARNEAIIAGHVAPGTTAEAAADAAGVQPVPEGEGDEPPAA